MAGQGATRNGEPIRASATAELEDCRMAGDPAPVRGIRPGPSPGQPCGSRRATPPPTACAWSPPASSTPPSPRSRKSDWDVAAGDLIAREAGCFVGDHNGEAFRYNRVRPSQASLICATPALAPLILARVGHMGASK